MSNKVRIVGIRVSDALRNDMKEFVGEGKAAETEAQFIRMAISEKIVKCRQASA